MDSPRAVIGVLLDRLRYLEKDRLQAMGSLRALSHVLFEMHPSLVEKYKAQKRLHAETLAVQYRDLDRVYDELAGTLKRHDSLEKEKQEEIRRALEAFEGPEQ